MFNKLISELKKMERLEIPIPIETDSDGYYDKECPSENCKFQFKVLADDWIEKFKNESVFCPLCGHNAQADTFWTTEQVENGEQQAFKYLESRLDKALSDGAKDFNSCQPKNSFISISMRYKGGKSNYYILPIPAKKELQQKITCSKCSSRYSVLGSAFFCPCCGYNSVLETFDNSLNKIETKLKNIELIRSTVSQISEDEAEVTARSLIESGLLDGVVAFQRFCELMYKKHIRIEKNIKRNAFQNLELGSEYWENLFNSTYRDWLSPDEFKLLTILFQKRHLLAHSEGIVDDIYIRNSGDTMYKIGQRIVVKKQDVIDLVRLIRKVTNKIRELGKM